MHQYCFYLQWHGWTPDVWAAWIQAIGSILAIGVAIWIPWRERRHSRRDAAAQRLLEGKLVAGAISPLVTIYLRRLNFFANQLAKSSDKQYLADRIPESTFDVPAVLTNFQPQLHVLGRTGVLVNEVIGDMHIMSMAARILHRERVDAANHAVMVERCNSAGGRAETLLSELDALCPPRRDVAIEEAAADGKMP